MQQFFWQALSQKWLFCKDTSWLKGLILLISIFLADLCIKLTCCQSETVRESIQKAAAEKGLAGIVHDWSKNIAAYIFRVWQAKENLKWAKGTPKFCISLVFPTWHFAQSANISKYLLCLKCSKRLLGCTIKCQFSIFQMSCLPKYSKLEV